MRDANPIINKRLVWVACLCAALSAMGCGDSGPGTVCKVTGKVTVGGVALTSGMVIFTPDTDKGNTSKWTASGPIAADGTYSLMTERKEGAPPGWYKVSINTSVPPGADLKPDQPPTPTISINAIYTNPNQSGIGFEVTESATPGAYDIPLKQ